MIKKWLIPDIPESKVNSLALTGHISKTAAKVLIGMGLDTVEKAAVFFGQDGDGQTLPLSDPFLIKDMQTACDVISDAVDSGELICIYGDYDCDGITSTAVLSDYLGNIGANVTAYINERNMGYGINPDAIRKLHEDGVGLIITVDNGISALEEAKLCKELGITLVVTDHHQPGEVLPEAAAVVDPHRADDTSPFKPLCGCGVALKLIAALEGGDLDFAVEQYSDIAAIATVADVVPLTGENRQIVRTGLKYLENTENHGLRELIAKAGLKAPYNSTSIAFGLAPRINAAGRTASPLEALSLLTTEDADEASALAERINDLNSGRRAFEERIMNDISAMVKADSTLLDRRVLFFCGKGWHHGVVGIVASRVTERFGKPSFLMSYDEDGGEVRGSARSFGEFNVFKALSACSELLVKFGGHSGAGGFTVAYDDIGRFGDTLEKYAANVLTEPLCPEIPASGTLGPEDLTEESIRGLDILEPFGEGNPKPVFLLPDAVIERVSPISDGKHTRLTINCGGITAEAPIFGTKAEDFPYRAGTRVNMLVSVGLNTYGSKTSVSLRVVDIRRTGLRQTGLIAAEDCYYKFRRGEISERRMLDHIRPERDTFAAVYKAIDGPCDVLGLYALTDGINLCKFLIALDVFDEAGLIDYDRVAPRITKRQVSGKADLEATPTMKKFAV